MAKHGKNRRIALTRAKISARKVSKSTGARSVSTANSRDKVRAHRARMRNRGFRLVQMWLPDTRSRDFTRQAHKASLAIANSQSEAEDQAFIDSVSWWNSPEAAELEQSEPATLWWRKSRTVD